MRPVSDGCLPTLAQIDHVALVTGDLDRLCAFYRLLGAESAPSGASGRGGRRRSEQPVEGAQAVEISRHQRDVVDLRKRRKATVTHRSHVGARCSGVHDPTRESARGGRCDRRRPRDDGRHRAPAPVAPGSRASRRRAVTRLRPRAASFRAARAAAPSPRSTSARPAHGSVDEEAAWPHQDPGDSRRPPHRRPVRKSVMSVPPLRSHRQSSIY